MQISQFVPCNGRDILYAFCALYEDGGHPGRIKFKFGVHDIQRELGRLNFRSLDEYEIRGNIPEITATEFFLHNFGDGGWCEAHISNYQ